MKSAENDTLLSRGPQMATVIATTSGGLHSKNFIKLDEGEEIRDKVV